MELPLFKYHPDPIATGAIVASSDSCECCGQARGFMYCTTPYGPNEIEFICPWCIADGSANRSLGAEFVDSSPLLAAGVPRDIVEEVAFRTPGYISWQQETWLACCGDACEFHGDAPASELLELEAEGMRQLSQDSGFSEGDLPGILEHYAPKGSPAFYKFVCRHCRATRYNGDMH